MRVLFVHAAEIADGTSEVASARLRALLPSQELRQRGHHAEVATVNDADSAVRAVEGLSRFDRLVVSKSFDPAVEDLLQAAQQRGLRTVADFCDDHFDSPIHGAHQRRLCELADMVSANTSGMAELVARHTGRTATVIEDPIEGRRGEPKAVSQASPSLLWFGHPSNLGTIGPLLAALPRFGRPLSLTLVTTPSEDLINLVEGCNKAFRRRLKVSLQPWSPSAMAAALDACDMVLLPTAAGDRPGRSANRVVEAMWAGRFVAAGPSPSYRELADLAWIGDDMPAAIAWAMAEPDAVVARITMAQQTLPQRFAPAVVAAAWETLLT